MMEEIPNVEKEEVVQQPLAELLQKEEQPKKKKSRNHRKKVPFKRVHDEDASSVSDLSEVAPGDIEPSPRKKREEKEPDAEEPTVEEPTVEEPTVEKPNVETEGLKENSEPLAGGGGGGFSFINPLQWIQDRLGLSDTMIRYGAMPVFFLFSLLIKLIFYFVTRSQVTVTVRAITKNSNACVLIDTENKHYHFQEDTLLSWMGIQTMNRTLWRDIHEGRRYKLYLSGGSNIQVVESVDR